MSEALVAQKGPYAVDVTAGKRYAWCACGRSQTQPLCDGSHKVTDLKPIVYKAEKDATVYFCGCKQSGKAPLCDGTHAAL
ncbi:CDGSH iron-sulfur domain-containing protein [Halomonas sp. GXIMD04776]|uniref:CDGSH iron-sulfur domain-containing protein n=1 Tax=Halomonas sp. GXIMD04776 TaxID=3415605 RepID=UPI003CB006B1